MDPAHRDSDHLERELLRRGVGALTSDRHTCFDCHRTPLIGEQLYFYEGGQAVCELCRMLRREPAQSSQLVRHSEYGHAVRLTIRAA